MALTRRSSAAEKLTVQSVHCAGVRHQNCDADVTNSHLAAGAAPVMVTGELDSLLEGFSITRRKFLSDNAGKVKMLQMFSKFS